MVDATERFKYNDRFIFTAEIKTVFHPGKVNLTNFLLPFYAGWYS